jgi:hypothetical protein
MNMTKEDMLRKIMESGNMIDPAAMSGMNPAAPIENLEINATMSNTTPGGGIDNIASTINDLATSPEGLRAVQENMGQGGMSFDLDKFNANMAAMPGLGITDVPSLELLRGSGRPAIQDPQVQALTAAGNNMGLMELIKRARSMGRM